MTHDLFNILYMVHYLVDMGNLMEYVVQGHLQRGY